MYLLHWHIFVNITNLLLQVYSIILKF